MEDPAECNPTLQDQLKVLLYSFMSKGILVVPATTRVAKLRFAQLVEQEFQSLLANPHTQEATFANRIQEIRVQVIAEMGELWAGQDDWFNQYCRPAPDGVDVALARLANEAALRARQLGKLRLMDAVHTANADAGQRPGGAGEVSQTESAVGSRTDEPALSSSEEGAEASKGSATLMPTGSNSQEDSPSPPKPQTTDLERSRLNKGGAPPGTKVNSTKLRELRGAEKQETLAQASGVDVDTISAGEQGKPWKELTFEKVAAGLSKLLGRHVEPHELKLKKTEQTEQT